MKRSILYIVLGILISACVYPIEVESIENEKIISMEGDIILGEYSTVNVRYVQNLDYIKSEDMEERPDGICWIEDNKKFRYTPVKSGNGVFVFDTRSLSKNKNYKVCYQDNSTGHTYSSTMLSVITAPTIDRLYYTLDENNVNISIDLTGSKNNRHFRWDWTQTWEYVADFAPNVYFDLEDQTVKYIYENKASNYDYYYCWNSAGYKDIGLGSVPSLQQEINLKAQDVLSIDRSNKKLSSLYRIEVEARGISYGCLQYLQNMKKNSSTTGDLFSPSPSNMTGNITSSQEDETVFGYINVCTIARDTLYIDYTDAYIQKNMEPYLFIPDLSGMTDLLGYYNFGYRPVITEYETGITYWAPKRCIDCRDYGGTKEKPEGWPSNNN